MLIPNFDLSSVNESQLLFLGLAVPVEKCESQIGKHVHISLSFMEGTLCPGTAKKI